MVKLLFLMTGGALGTLARYLASGLARRLNMAGATVLKGVMGFGASSRIHTTKVLRLSEDLPMVIEIIDKKERINLLMPFLDAHVKEGLITLEEVRVIKYRHNKPD